MSESSPSTAEVVADLQGRDFGGAIVQVLPLGDMLYLVAAISDAWGNIIDHGLHALRNGVVSLVAASISNDLAIGPDGQLFFSGQLPGAIGFELWQVRPGGAPTLIREINARYVVILPGLNENVDPIKSGSSPSQFRTIQKQNLFSGLQSKYWYRALEYLGAENLDARSYMENGRRLNHE